MLGLKLIHVSKGGPGVTKAGLWGHLSNISAVFNSDDDALKTQKATNGDSLDTHTSGPPEWNLFLYTVDVHVKWRCYMNACPHINLQAHPTHELGRVDHKVRR